MSASSQSFSHRFFTSLWYRHRALAWPLLPFSWLFRFLAALRRGVLRLATRSLPVPVVVVGNIAVGGTGKTPVVVTLVRRLQAKGIKVGVISRGYGRTSEEAHYLVTADSPVERAGDEPLAIVRETGCPLMVGSDRRGAAKALLKQHPELQLLISDDGLQHYRLPRALEIVVIDGERGLGNGYCLPAGPLREPVSRLKNVKWVLVNGELNNELAAKLPNAKSFTLKPCGWQQLTTRTDYPLNPFPWAMDKDISAIAAIGNPERFFNALNNLGVEVKPHSFDDHYRFKVEDFQRLRRDVLLMTTKDAVKCAQYANNDWWALYVAAELPQELLDDVFQLVRPLNE